MASLTLGTIQVDGDYSLASGCLKGFREEAFSSLGRAGLGFVVYGSRLGWLIA